MTDDPSYLLTILRHQSNQIDEMAKALAMLGRGLSDMARAYELLRQRLLLVEAQYALEQMRDEERVVQ